MEIELKQLLHPIFFRNFLNYVCGEENPGNGI